MKFIGISKVFSTANNEQYETIGRFWDDLSKIYGEENLVGLGYNWTDDYIEYAIGLKNKVIDQANCSVEIPDKGWVAVCCKECDLQEVYEQIYSGGSLKYELEMFYDGNCEIRYVR